MGQFSILLGAITIISMLIAKKILSVCKWRTAALLTPFIMLTTITIFTVFSNYREWPFQYSETLTLILWIGAIHCILIKATKYSLFDPSKEMVYIPLDQTLKTKGKASVDVIGSRLAKGSGGLIQSFIFMSTGMNLSQLTVIFIIIIIATIGIWICSIICLDSLMNGLKKKHNHKFGL